MDDDGPDFGYAFGSQPTTPLWNPAIRPDTPGIALQSSQQHNEGDSVSSQNIQTDKDAAFSQNMTVTGDKETSVASDTQQVSSPSQAQNPSPSINEPMPHAGETSVHTEQEQSQPTESTAISHTPQDSDQASKPSVPISRDDAQPLERALSYTPLYPGSTDEHVSRAVQPPSETHAPDEQYEAQGESTFLDEALQEAPSLPLIASEDTTQDWDQSTDYFGSSVPAGTVNSEAVETTHAADSAEGTVEIAKEIVTGDESPALDWGTITEEEPLFSKPAEEPAKEQGFEVEWPGDAADDFAIGNSGESQAANKPQDADMSAWEAAFGDDELLEEDSSKAGAGPAFFEDDGEGFLDEAPVSGSAGPASATTNAAAASSGSKYAPATRQNPARPQNNAYAPQGPQFTDFSQLSRNASTPQSSLGGYQQVPAYGAVRPQIKPAGDGRSFSDKAKTGYASPYDLPADLSKAQRRRPAGANVARQAQPTPPAPPPRSSSYGFPPAQELSRMQPNTSVGAPGQPRPTSSGSAYLPSQGSQPRKASLEKQPGTPTAGGSSFFEDLPVTQRPRPQATNSGRYTPAVTPQPQQAPTFASGPPQGARTAQMPPQSLQQQAPPQTPYGQFRQPDRPAMFPDQPTVPASGPPRPPAAPSNRYSPAPGSAPSAGMAVPSTAAPRYSPAPPPQSTGASNLDRYTSAQTGPPKPPVKPFQPRTSSPLTHFTSAQQDEAVTDTSKPLPEQPPYNHQTSPPYHEQTPQVQQDGIYQNGYSAARPTGTNPTMSPPPQPQTLNTASPRKRSYAPSSQLPLVPETSAVPPLRSQSGSPGSNFRNSKLAITPIDRPASAYDLPSPKRDNASLAGPFSLPHRRGFSQEMNFIPPQDEQVHDPLQRWKGRPIFTWGPAGHVVTVFPKHVPRYGGGQAAPMIKATPGDPKLQSVKDILGTEETLSSFPGPLKKSKKKEVIAWLKSVINSLEKQTQMTSYQVVMPQEAKKSEEKLILWRTMLVMVENDGILEGTPAIQEAVRAILAASDGQSTSEPGSALVSSSRRVEPEAVNPLVVHSIREHLSKGDREKAAWMAVDERLWGHAMLISSTLNKDIWKQVIQEFVRKEVKTAGSGNEPLAALYEVFAGNWNESIDQLVPASARAGFRMINTVDPSAGSADALAGLDKWRETLLLILSNRSTEDGQAILALGKLLADYGRTEAAHTCYLFAHEGIHFSGADDLQANLTLLGADPRFHVDFGKDMESIMLSEVFEFASSLSAAASTSVPHLQSYKMYHALTLLEAGNRNEAQQYCDHIASLVSSKTKLSPYYNPHFIAALDDLSKRLNQTPSSSSSIFSKPNVDKVSSSFFKKFNSFVAGDETDSTSNGSRHEEVGPFARISGDTPPTISRTTSLQDMYGTYSNGGPVGGNAQPTGRYAPSTAGSAYAPRTSLDQARPQQYNQYAPQSTRTSLDSVRQGDSNHGSATSDYNPYSNAPAQHSQQSSQASTYSPPQQRSYAASLPRAASYQGVSGANGQSAPSLAPYTPPVNAYTPSPYAMTPEPESAAPLPHEQRQPSPQLQQTDSLGYKPRTPVEPETAGYRPLPSDVQQSPQQPASYEPSSQASLDEQTSGYRPPTSSYEPPSYQSYEPQMPAEEATEHPEESEAPKTKKKSFMDDDDDDDLARRAAALKLEGKSKADREADDAFKKAAEADANRPAAQQRGSWFGGWFKKDPNAPQQGPIKAKLGEQSSFVYDPELKRWVDKKNPQATTAVAATPPPPKGPMGGMRAASGTPMTSTALSAPPPTGMRAASGPPLGSMPSTTSAPPVQPTGSGPPSRVGTPASIAGDAAPPLGPPTGTTGPPSRPTTSMSNASSLDDLIGPAAGRKGPSKKKGRGGRYVDVMANQG